MRLKNIIKNIEEKLHGWSKPNLTEYAKNLWPEYIGSTDQVSTYAILTNIVNSYLNDAFISKMEGIFWMKSANSEIQELRKRIEYLESKIIKDEYN